MTIYEAEYLSHVWTELEERLDVPVTETVLKSQHLALRDYLENHIFYGWRKHLVRGIPLILLMNGLASESALFGFGNIEVLEYHRGKVVVMRIRSPFDIISLAGGIRGSFEVLERRGSELAWTEEEDGDYIVTIVPRPREDELEAGVSEALRTLRMVKKEAAGKPVPVEGSSLERCPSCGLPAALAELEWREDDGVIYHRDSGKRFVFSTGYIFLGVIRELELKKGQDIDPVVLDITRGYHRRILRDIPVHTRGGTYRAMAEYLSVGGYGVVVNSSYGEGHLEMTIQNPHYPPRLVGQIAGLFEHVEGEEADIEYRSPQPQVLELEIKTT